MKSIRLVTVLAAMLALLAAPAWAAPSVGRVTDVLGKAMVKRSDGQSLTIRTFTPLFEGDEIETGGDGRVKMLFSDDSVISLSPNTVFQVAQMAFNQQKQERTGLFSLLRGRVRAAVAKYSAAIKSRYEIKTPTAVAGIRGTTLTLGSGIPGLSDFLALEDGEVQWCQGSNCIDIPAGVVALIGENGQWIQQALSQGAWDKYVDPGKLQNQDPDYDGGGYEGDPGPLTPEQINALKQLGDQWRTLPNTDERQIAFQQILENSTILNIRLRF